MKVALPDRDTSLRSVLSLAFIQVGSSKWSISEWSTIKLALPDRDTNLHILVLWNGGLFFCRLLKVVDQRMEYHESGAAGSGH